MARLTLETGRYFEAEGILSRARSSAPAIGNNTRLERLAADRIAVRFHATLIYTMTLAGWAVIDCAGWRSVTTLQRVNALLPGPWRIGSYGKRGTWLYSGGRPIAPFADGMAVRVGNAGSDARADGAVGFSPDRGATIAPLLSADDVTGIIAAADAAQAERERKRAERLEREHPVARTVTYRADLAHSRAYGASTSPMPSRHRMGAWRAVSECGRCAEEAAEWREIRAATLAADHDDRHAWAVTVNGAIMTEPANGPGWNSGEPFDCPRRNEGKVSA